MGSVSRDIMIDLLNKNKILESSEISVNQEEEWMKIDQFKKVYLYPLDEERVDGIFKNYIELWNDAIKMNFSGRIQRKQHILFYIIHLLVLLASGSFVFLGTALFERASFPIYLLAICFAVLWFAVYKLIGIRRLNDCAMLPSLTLFLLPLGLLFFGVSDSGMIVDMMSMVQHGADSLGLMCYFAHEQIECVRASILLLGKICLYCYGVVFLVQCLCPGRNYYNKNSWKK